MGKFSPARIDVSRSETISAAKGLIFISGRIILGAGRERVHPCVHLSIVNILGLLG